MIEEEPLEADGDLHHETIEEGWDEPWRRRDFKTVPPKRVRPRISATVRFTYQAFTRSHTRMEWEYRDRAFMKDTMSIYADNNIQYKKWASDEPRRSHPSEQTQLRQSHPQPSPPWSYGYPTRTLDAQSTRIDTLHVLQFGDIPG